MKSAMSHVERFRAVMNFEPFDRLPCIEWATWWDKTIARWKSEGLPAGLNDPYEIVQYLGLDHYKQFWINTIDHSEQVDVEGTVTNIDDYRKLKPHIFPQREFEHLCLWQQKQQCGESLVWITLEGFFWFPRTLLGIEKHMYAFYDMPELMHTINKDLADYNIAMIRKIVKICRPTFVTFAEDMSYNHGPMLSKDAFTEFLAPYYRKVIPVLEEYNIIPMIDTDGNVTAMAPWLIDVGIKGVLPLERQAGVDANKLRADFPTLRMVGHFDKMVLNKGETAIRNEFERLRPVMKSGGFIPSVDHQTPPGVSLGQYRTYLKLLHEYSLIYGS